MKQKTLKIQPKVLFLYTNQKKTNLRSETDTTSTVTTLTTTTGIFNAKG